MPSPRNPGSVRASFRVLVAVYLILAVAATARSVYQIVRDFDAAPLAYGLSATAAVVYAVCALAISRAHRAGWARLAWAAVSFELIGVLVVGVLSGTHPELFPAQTVWSGFGRGYGYVPLVLPICGLAALESGRLRSEVIA